MVWTPADIPDQTGRSFVVTGANSGIGYHAARHLANRGADVVLACRRLDAAEVAADRINAKARGQARAVHLDLEDLDSVRAFAKQAPETIDVLVNNAGIMMVPRRLSPQGIEAQWAINVVGHALLTRLLLPRITDRVVTISSIAHRYGRIDPATWTGERYDAAEAYRQSKLGDLMFALRLQRHLDEQGSPVRSVAAHPGGSLTRLAKDMRFVHKLGMIPFALLIQGADKGSWPTLRAAVDDVPGGSYWGPRFLREIRGAPVEARIEPHARDEAVQELVWNAVWRDDPAEGVLRASRAA